MYLLPGCPFVPVACRVRLVLACLQLCETDFFLEPLKGAVNEHARLLIFETYCRIHKRINVE